ncbi:MAG TPA: hypothetical protein VGO62_14215, partial [Myxococcota bacterium]
MALAIGVIARIVVACLVGGEQSRWHTIGRAVLAGDLVTALAHGFPVSSFGVAWAAACAAVADNAHAF